MSGYRIVETVNLFSGNESTGWFHGFAQVNGECCALVEDYDGHVYPHKLSEYSVTFKDHNNLPVPPMHPSQTSLSR